MSAACAIEMPAEVTVHGSWIATDARFDSLRAEWTDLFERARVENAFLSFDWMWNWWRHFGTGRLAIIAVRTANGRLIAIAPFYIARGRLGFLTDDHVGSDYLNIIADAGFETLAAAEIVRVLLARRRNWDYVALRDMGNSALVMELERAGLRPEQAARRICYYIPLPTTFDAFLAGLSTSLRCNYRRRWRILQQEHQGEYLVLSGAAEIEHYFSSLIELHRMRFEQRKCDSAFLAPGVPEFHVEAMRALARNGLARLLLLRANGEAVAAIYGFTAGGTFQFYQCGMHPGWMRHGVGQVLIGKAIEYAIATGCTTFDFLRGDESYKSQWTQISRELVTMRFFDDRPASVMAHMRIQCYTRIRGWVVASARRILRNSPQ